MNMTAAIETKGYIQTTLWCLLGILFFFFTEINLETGVHRNKMAEKELQEQVI